VVEDQTTFLFELASVFGEGANEKSRITVDAAVTDRAQNLFSAGVIRITAFQTRWRETTTV
jgi:hypothetical protein